MPFDAASQQAFNHTQGIRLAPGCRSKRFTESSLLRSAICSADTAGSGCRSSWAGGLASTREYVVGGTTKDWLRVSGDCATRWAWTSEPSTLTDDCGGVGCRCCAVCLSGCAGGRPSGRAPDVPDSSLECSAGLAAMAVGARPSPALLAGEAPAAGSGSWTTSRRSRSCGGSAPSKAGGPAGPVPDHLVTGRPPTDCERRGAFRCS